LYNFSLLAVLFAFSGCKQSNCSESTRLTGDLDDTANQKICNDDAVAFSPQVIDSSSFGKEKAAEGGAGGSTVVDDSGTKVTVLAEDSDGQPRTLYHLEVFECAGKNSEEKAVEATVLVASATSSTQGACVALSATRLDCLTDFNGRASFSLKISGPTNGALCAKIGSKNSGLATLTINNGSGGSGGASSSGTSSGAGGAAGSTTVGGAGGAT
jgi:hypothetical protein